MTAYGGLAGKTVVVSGGAQGIGRAICEEFLAAGARVVVADVDVRHGSATESELAETYGAAVLFHETDIASEDSVNACSRRAYEVFGSVDVLVNCAAAFIMRGIDATPDEWRRMVDVNVIGYALCAKHAVPYMRRAGKGSIVNISSISAFIAQPGLLTYSTTKAAVTNLTRLMAQELAPSIRVNAVCPGTVWSANNAAVIARTMGLDREEADAHPDVGGKAMLRRTADPVEIAKPVVFLASDDASYVTGENFVVDGGYLAQ